MALPHEELRRMARKYPLLRRRVEAAIALEDADALHSLPPERRVEELEAENAQLRKTLSDLVLGKIVLTRDDATNI